MTLPDLPDNHDLDHLRAALAYVEHFGLAVDGGAHRGIWTRPLCDAFEQVVAVEPTTRAAMIDSRAVVFQAALGERPGICSMREGTENTGQAHVVEGDSVQIRTLDSLNLPRLDFLKLDVEGYEYLALLGGEATIRAFKPVILVEENGLCQRYGVSPGWAGDLLTAWGAAFREKCNKDWIWSW